MAARRAVIVSTARTGLAKSFRGGFNATHGAAMAGHAIQGAIEKAGIESGPWAMFGVRTAKSSCRGPAIVCGPPLCAPPARRRRPGGGRHHGLRHARGRGRHERGAQRGALGRLPHHHQRHHDQPLLLLGPPGPCDARSAAPHGESAPLFPPSPPAPKPRAPRRWRRRRTASSWTRRPARSAAGSTASRSASSR